MKSRQTVILAVATTLLCLLSASASISEIKGGMNVVASNGGYIEGVSTQTSTTVYLGDAESTFTREFNDDETQGFSALFANDDRTFGTVDAYRYSNSITTAQTPEDAASFALLPFKAPDKPMNILLIKNGMPKTITINEFKTSITNAGGTWNAAGKEYGRTFFGSVSEAPASTSPQRNDGKFVHSFKSYWYADWIAANWLTWNSVTNKLVDSDVIYNTKYTFDTEGTIYNYEETGQKIADLTAVALHELGHNLGLDDIYNKDDLKWDTDEVMNAYIWGAPRYKLGKGDLAGLKAKYG